MAINIPYIAILNAFNKTVGSTLPKSAPLIVPIAHPKYGNVTTPIS